MTFSQVTLRASFFFSSSSEMASRILDLSRWCTRTTGQREDGVTSEGEHKGIGAGQGGDKKGPSQRQTGARCRGSET